MLYKQEELDKFWDVAKNDYKIQQIREEWEWLIGKTVNTWDRKKSILEIGCYDGGSTHYLSNFAGNMITMDLHDPARFDTSKIVGPYDYHYIGGDSHSRRNLDKLYSITCDKWDDAFEFAFIDGDHSYEGVKADFQNVKSSLWAGAAVVFHDIVISDFHHDHGCYVGEFWRDLKEQGYKTEEFCMHKDWAGIGILWI